MITPEFEQGFYDLCEKHNVKAAFIAVTSTPVDTENVNIDFFTGGHKQTCGYVKALIEMAMGKNEKN